VARRQLNLITTGQLHAAGFGDSAITRRQKKATLHRVHQAVYLYGTDLLLPGASELAARSRSGIAVHRVAELLDVDRGFASGIPVVSPALALLEFADVAAGDELERRMKLLLRQAGLPTPTTRVKLAGFRADFLLARVPGDSRS
jgi:hypothetical protein